MEHYLTRLETRLVRHWDEPALSDYRGALFTAAEVAEQFARLHLLFKACGVKQGDKIALAGLNSAHWAMAFLAAATYRAVVVPILADFTNENIQTLADHSESKILFTEQRKWADMDPEKLPNIAAVLSIEDYSLIYTADKQIEQAFANQEETFKKAYPKGVQKGNLGLSSDRLDDLAIINYTSGTTGAPKGIMLTNRNLSSNVDFAVSKIPVPANARIMSMLPLAHMYGLAFEFLYPFCGGAHVTFLGKTPSPTVLMAAFAEIKPYILITVPLVMEKIIKGKVMPVLAKPAMRVMTKIPVLKGLIYKKIREQIMAAFGGNVCAVIMGGAALNPTIERVLRAAKIPYTVGYGMTECAPLVAYQHSHLFKPGSCGCIVTHNEIRVDSSDPQRKVGELQVRGANVMIGYYKNEEATEAVFTEDGWLRTGDLGVIDAAGNIFIRGRSKCMILSSNGQNIYPEEIEAKLNTMPYVAESLIVERDKRLVAIVFPHEEQLKGATEPVEVLLEQTRKLANAELPMYSQIAKIEVIEGGFVHTPKHSIKRCLYA